MLEKENIQKAIQILSIYEEAFYPNQQAVGDIEDGLYWDEERQCFSADVGLLLRGECEDVRIFRDYEWLERPFELRNTHYATVCDDRGGIYFIETLPIGSEAEHA